MSDPTDAARAVQGAATAVADNAGHLILAGAAAGAAVLRLATYTGPARPWRAVILDGFVMLVVAFGVAECVMGWTDNAHGAIGAGLMSGLLGWEAIKRVAMARAAKDA